MHSSGDLIICLSETRVVDTFVKKHLVILAMSSIKLWLVLICKKNEENDTKVQDFPSNRIFGRMHKVLNIDKNKN